MSLHVQCQPVLLIRVNSTSKYLVFCIFQAGTFQTIQPEAIKAQDGDTGISTALIYSISTGEECSFSLKFKLKTPLEYVLLSVQCLQTSIRATSTSTPAAEL